MYPLASFADTNLSSRLRALKWISPSSTPSLRTSFLRKLTSRCLDYARDFGLKSFLYDVAMARTITSLINVANQRQIAPEFASMQQDMFEGYWLLQVRKMEDICRREYESTGDMTRTFPNVFSTIAPAEWSYLLPEGLALDDSLSEQQDLITLHLHHTMGVLLETQLIKHEANLASVGIARIRHWSYRFEFQSRGTLHLHGIFWADLLPNWTAAALTARTGESTSPFLALLETLFKCRSDVQCGDGSHCLMKYVAGYVLKASDALQFISHQVTDEDTRWRQAYRLLCKRSPTEQELVMEFAGLSMVKHSFTGFDVFAPIPGSKATNNSRRMYDVYQRCIKKNLDARGLTFIQWIRFYQLASENPDSEAIQLRNQAGPGKGKPCSAAVSFPFELLDIYIGAWAASCLPGMLEERLWPIVPIDLNIPGFEDELVRRRSFTAPSMCEHLKAVLSLDEFLLAGADPHAYHPDLARFFARIEPELKLRGINADRISTFKAKVEATNILLLHIRDGLEDAGFWTASSLPSGPRRQWSPEQQAVLNWVKNRLRIDDAADASNRVLQVSGPPGTGKTEVVIAAAQLALRDDCRVLIVGSIGLLVAMYRLRLPANERLTMETIHTAFKLTRDADAAYIPPGRLRRYDIIIFEQIDGQVWGDLKTALGELHPGPLLLFVGDFEATQSARARGLLCRQNLDTDRRHRPSNEMGNSDQQGFHVPHCDEQGRIHAESSPTCFGLPCRGCTPSQGSRHPCRNRTSFVDAGNESAAHLQRQQARGLRERQHRDSSSYAPTRRVRHGKPPKTISPGLPSHPQRAQVPPGGLRLRHYNAACPRSDTRGSRAPVRQTQAGSWIRLRRDISSKAEVKRLSCRQTAADRLAACGRGKRPGAHHPVGPERVHGQRRGGGVRAGNFQRRAWHIRLRGVDGLV